MKVRLSCWRLFVAWQPGLTEKIQHQGQRKEHLSKCSRAARERQEREHSGNYHAVPFSLRASIALPCTGRCLFLWLSQLPT